MFTIVLFCRRINKYCYDTGIVAKRDSSPSLCLSNQTTKKELFDALFSFVGFIFLRLQDRMEKNNPHYHYPYSFPIRHHYHH